MRLAPYYTALGTRYETVAAAQTTQALGAVGAVGDYLKGILVIPATTSPGALVATDGTAAITLFTGGTTSVANILPFYLPLGIHSTASGWKITTGSNMSVVGIGEFT